VMSGWGVNHLTSVTHHHSHATTHPRDVMTEDVGVSVTFKFGGMCVAVKV